LPDESGNYKKFGGERLPKCPKLNGKSKLNSLSLSIRVVKKAPSTNLITIRVLPVKSSAPPF